MSFRSGMIVALSAGLLAMGGCAAAGPAGPVTSPTGKVYEAGTAPKETKLSQTATLFLAQQAYEQALEQAQQGIQADTANPIHYFLAGQAYAGLGQAEEANRMFATAERIYPAYELEIEPVREQLWADAFNRGVEAYNAGNLEEAAEAWALANALYDLRNESFLNLAVIYTQQNEYDRAIEAYRGALAALEREPATRELTPEEVAERAEARKTVVTNLAELLSFTERYAEAEQLYREQLEAEPDNVQLQSQLALALAKQGREAEAQEIYTRLLAQPNLSANDLFNLGVALFNAKDYAQAAEAFRGVTEILPNSRDAWYNLANALYAQNEYAELVPVAERLVELDPLNENSALILARAYRETKQNQKALQVLQEVDADPIHIEDLQIQPREGRTRVTGRAIGNKAAPGTPVQLRFTFYGPDGELGAETVTVNAPAEDASTNFEVVFESPTPVAAYRYELVR